MARQEASERTAAEAVTSQTAAGAPALTGRGAARRTVVAAVGAAGLTAALAACGSSMTDAGPTGSQPAGGGADGGAGGSGSASGSAGGDGSAGGGAALAKAAEIPTGGGKIFKAERVVVTQPKDGEIKAFSAVCTHAGCLVGEVADGTINCLCHGSKFDITDGSVQSGPATRPLPPAKVDVKGGSVTLG
ncbi:Rieske (2Fe-2S) protein [Streptomyces sp. NPDC048506]|uniref:Rieske (2Fe-2S) protein n=1 Tax=Streptomyces sp. NPDC048506 TaxID=3155028 RepID=UPI00344ACFFC